MKVFEAEPIRAQIVFQLRNPVLNIRPTAVIPPGFSLSFLLIGVLEFRIVSRTATKSLGLFQPIDCISHLPTA